MKIVKQVVEKLGIVPRLSLAVQKTDDKGKVLGVESTGPHRVKFLSEPKNAMGKDPMTSQERQEFHFEVEENGVKKQWIVPMRNKQGEGNYILAKLMEIEVGDEAILEVKRRGPKNYTSVTRIGHDSDEIEDGLPDEETIESALAAEADKTSGPWDDQSEVKATE